MKERASSHRHLEEDALLELWVRDCDADPVQTPVEVRECEPCREAYANLLATIDGLREEVVAEADAVFTPERLAAQRAHILRRIANGDRPARVLPFPVASRTAPARQPTARRWIAAAAAAGLLVGAIAGKFIDPWSAGRRGLSRTPILSQAAPSGLAPLPGATDEDILIDIEDALESPVINGLETIDAMTPVVQTVAVELK